MKELLTTTLDALVYLLPGLTTLAALLYLVSPVWLTKPEAKLGVGQSLVAGAMALVVGMMLLRLSALVPWALERYYGEPVLIGNIKSYLDLDAARAIASERTPALDTGVVNVYLTAQTVIEEGSPRNAELARRLMSIALLTRSLVLAAPVLVAVLAVAVFRHFPRTRRRFLGPAYIPHVIGAIVALALSEYVLGRAYLAYSSASVHRVLRAFVLQAPFP